jgi:hypothetical protein
VSADQSQPPPEVNAAARGWMDAIIDRLQSKDAACRHQGAAEVAELLAVPSVPASTTGRTNGYSARLRAILVTASLTILAVGVMSWWALQHASSEGPSNDPSGSSVAAPARIRPSRPESRVDEIDEELGILWNHAVVVDADLFRRADPDPQDALLQRIQGLTERVRSVEGEILAGTQRPPTQDYGPSSSQTLMKGDDS